MANKVEYSIIGTDKLSKPFGKAVTSIKSVAKAAAAVTAAVTATASAVFAMTNKITQSQDRMAKFASRIGTTTEQLSTLEFTADKAGLSARTLDMAVQRMTRRVAEAATGTGEAVSALNDLNISASAFQKLPLNDQLGVLADRLNGVETQAEKVRIAFKLFDSEGVAMLQMLQNGSAGMQQLAKDAEFLGVVLNSKAAKNAEIFQDQLSRVQDAFTGLGYALTEDIVPIFSWAMNSIANFIAENRDNIVNFVKGSVQNFLTFINVVGQIGTTFSQIFSGNSEVLSNFLISIGNFVGRAVRMLNLLGEALGMAIFHGVNAAKNILNDFGTWLGKAIYNWSHGKEVQDFSEEFAASLTKNLGEAGDAIKSRLDAIAAEMAPVGERMGDDLGSAFGINLEAATAAAKEQLDSIMLQADEMGKSVISAIGQTSEAAQAISETAGINIANNYATFEEAMLAKIQEFYEAAGSIHNQMADLMMSTIDQVSQGIGQSFADALVYGKNIGKSLETLFKQVIAQVIQSYVAMQVQRSILSATNIASAKAEGSVEAGKAVGLTAANTMASMSAAPFPINLTAPAVAATHSAIAQALFVAGQAAGAAIGQADAGMNKVPRSGTYMLSQGERVIPPEQNKDLTDFLKEGAGGGSVMVENITIDVLPNATNADAMLELSPTDWKEIVAGPIIEALNALNKRGVKPEFA